jgi:IS5 family transposase
MRQMSLARQVEFQRFAKTSRPEQSPVGMDAAMPWAELQTPVEPHYPKGERGRSPLGLGIMPRLYFVQHRFAFSDPAAEELYNSAIFEAP